MKKFLTALLVTSLIAGITLSAQESDPFYLELLEKGEQSFLAGKYNDSVKELEIAVFGLYGEESLKGKAYVYLGLSYYYLKNNDKCEKYLRDAANLIGVEALNAIDIDESVWIYLEKLLIQFKLKEPEKGESRVREPERIQIRSLEGPKLVADLEKRIKAQPRNVESYYELYELHMKNNNPKEAKKTLKNLITKNPYEAKGFYLLGRLQYQERKFKDAVKNLDKVSKLQSMVPVEEYILLEAKAYQILSIHLGGDRKKASKTFAESANILTEERIRFLDLGEKDMSIFKGITESEAVRAETERIKKKIGLSA